MGNRVTGIEFTNAMHERAVTKIHKLKSETRSLITLKVQDILKGTWGNDYNVTIMGANAFLWTSLARATNPLTRIYTDLTS